MMKRVADRVARLKRLLAREGCSHFLITDPIDVEYVCGFHASRSMLLISRGEQLLFTDFRYRDAARRHCIKSGTWEQVEMEQDSFRSLKRFVGAGSVVGIQSHILTVDEYMRLKRALRRVTFAKIGHLPDQVCIPKLPHEIRAMRKAARIGDRAFLLFTGELRAGMTERQAARRLEDHCRELGSRRPSFETIVLFGERSSLPHGTPSARRLRSGDWVLMDFGCVIDGFCSDLTRTIVYGTAAPRQRRIYSIVARAQEHARRTIRAGMSARRADALARDSIDGEGYGSSFGHATGHGVGRRVHEQPRLSSRSGSRLVTGSVVTIEPGIYLPGFGGVRIEDMVLLRPGGATLLTHATRRLVETERFPVHPGKVGTR